MDYYWLVIIYISNSFVVLVCGFYMLFTTLGSKSAVSGMYLTLYNIL